MGRLSVARTSETPYSTTHSASQQKVPFSGGVGSSTFSAAINSGDASREKSHEAAAQRVFDNLNEIIQFERQHTHYYTKSNNSNNSSDDFETKSNADSGIGTDPSGAIASLDSWRMQAETALRLPEDFCLEATKKPLEKIENISEYSLTFLRPAPPKMSMRPAQIRSHLFATYKSVAPPVDDENLLKKPVPPSPRRIKLGPIKSTTTATIRSTPNSAKFNLVDELDESDDVAAKLSSKKSINIEEDTDDFEDSDMEFAYIVEKILNRQYKSETDLSKMKWHEEVGEEESTRGFAAKKVGKFLCMKFFVFSKLIIFFM
jgi:hypothetical protein